jgi:16S rRNA (adenine1518-N6/adenine1519-N6)-dimethyltransferase
MTQKANRHFGQNFLIAPGIARRIIDLAGVEEQDFLLEIGPGKGALTDLLLQRGAQVWAIEIDDALSAALQERYLANNCFHLVTGDFLQCELNIILNSAPPGTQWKLVSNLPYNEGTAILRRLIDFKSRLKHMTVMLQKEVADRLLAKAGSRDIGFLTHLMGCHFEIRKGFNVGPGAFRPIPKVNSTVVQLIPRADSAAPPDYPFYLQMVGLAFRQRRKTLRNACASLAIDPALLTDLLAQRGLPANARAEELSMESFAWLAEQLSLTLMPSPK